MCSQYVSSLTQYASAKDKTRLLKLSQFRRRREGRLKESARDPGQQEGYAKGKTTKLCDFSRIY